MAATLDEKKAFRDTRLDDAEKSAKVIDDNEAKLTTGAASGVKTSRDRLKAKIARLKAVPLEQLDVTEVLRKMVEFSTKVAEIESDWTGSQTKRDDFDAKHADVTRFEAELAAATGRPGPGPYGAAGPGPYGAAGPGPYGGAGGRPVADITRDLRNANRTRHRVGEDLVNNELSDIKTKITSAATLLATIQDPANAAKVALCFQLRDRGHAATKPKVDQYEADIPKFQTLTMGATDKDTDIRRICGL